MGLRKSSDTLPFRGGNCEIVERRRISDNGLDIVIRGNTAKSTCYANILRASLYPGPFMSSANLVADSRAWSKCFMLSICLSIWAMASAVRHTFVIYHRS